MQTLPHAPRDPCPSHPQHAALLRAGTPCSPRPRPVCDPPRPARPPLPGALHGPEGPRLLRRAPSRLPRPLPGSLGPAPGLPQSRSHPPRYPRRRRRRHRRGRPPGCPRRLARQNPPRPPSAPPPRGKGRAGRAKPRTVSAGSRWPRDGRHRAGRRGRFCQARPGQPRRGLACAARSLWRREGRARARRRRRELGWGRWGCRDRGRGSRGRWCAWPAGAVATEGGAPGASGARGPPGLSR